MEKGKSAASINDYNTALIYFTKAIALNHKNLEAYENRTSLCIKTGKEIEAIDDCTKGIKLNPNNGSSYYSRRECYASLKNTLN